MGWRIARMSGAALLAVGVSYGADAQFALEPVVFQPTPMTNAVTISPGGYPIESLLANEEGQTVLNVTVGPDGHVTEATVESSSGYQRLDAAAVRIAKTLWVYEPQTRDGQPVSVRTSVEVNWPLPLGSAEAFLLDVALPGLGARVTVIRPGTTEANVIVADDYPDASVERNEQGEALLKIYVLEDGRVGEAVIEVSSGYERLDNAALRAVTGRWQFTPGTVNGQAAPMWILVRVYFGKASAPPTEGQVPRICDSVPLVFRDARFDPNTEGPLRVTRWTEVTEEGQVANVLLLTVKGWMRFGSPFIAQLDENFYVVPVINGRPARCWYETNVIIER